MMNMAVDPEQESHYISIWSKAVDTQMHFNEMCVKSRQLGLTFVAAALGVAVVLLSRGDDFALVVDIKSFEFQIHVGVVLILGAWLALEAVKGLDLNVYHKMLRGAVTFGEDFEENYMKRIIELDKGMTQAISHFSRYADARTEKSSAGKFIYSGAVRVTAEDKIREFYKRTMRFLWIAAFALFIVTNVPLWISVDTSPSGQVGGTSNATSSPPDVPGNSNE
jgi:hypothetical protein